MDILFLVGGLLLILLGANGLTDGAASVAKRFHIPSIVIGLTIVAFGTSAPELTVSISSALKGSADIAIGNVVGSNTFNTLMIVGCTALFAPIAITRNTLKREIPLCILSSFAEKNPLETDKNNDINDVSLYRKKKKKAKRKFVSLCHDIRCEKFHKIFAPILTLQERKMVGIFCETFRT
jgi:hypothetical protein